MQPYTSLRYILSFLWYTLGSVHALTYWTDPSCQGKLSESVLTEAISFHSRANYRMHLNADYNQATAFSLLFKVPYADTHSYNEVDRITAVAGGFTPTNDHPNSELRVYCDDDEAGPDKRWRPVPDIPNLPEGVVPNSRKTYGVDQEMYDPINGIRSALNLNEKTGCKLEGIHAETFVHRFPTAGQNENRTTLTICDQALRSALQTIEKDLPLKQDIIKCFANPSEKIVDAFEAVLSFTIAHELTHHRLLGATDAEDSYGWEKVVNRTLFNNTDSLQGADHYAFFGLLAKLADRKWRLSKKAPQAAEGCLVYDKDIPRK